MIIYHFQKNVFQGVQKISENCIWIKKTLKIWTNIFGHAFDSLFPFPVESQFQNYHTIYDAIATANAAAL